MKKGTYLFFIMLIFLSAAVFANPTCMDEGDTLRCKSGTVESIDYKGDIVLDGTTVLDKVKAIGDFTAKNANVNQLNIVGDVKIINSIVNGSAVIVGDVQARQTKFESDAKIVGDTDFDFCEFRTDVVLTGDANANLTLFRGLIQLNAYNSYFSNSTLNELTVKKQSRDTEQIIYLKGGSIANQINFTGGKGLVELSDGSNVLGKVIGGKIHTKQK